MVCVRILVILIAFGCTGASENCDETSLLQGILPSRRDVSKQRGGKTEPDTFTHLAAELGRPGETPNHRHMVETELSDEALHELSGELNEYIGRSKELRQIPETNNGQQQRLALLQELEERADELASDFNQLAGLETELGEMEMEASNVEGTPSLLETHTKDGGSSGSWRRRRRRWFEAIVATVASTVAEAQDAVAEVIDAVQTIDGEDDGVVDRIIDGVQDALDLTQTTTLMPFPFCQNGRLCEEGVSCCSGTSTASCNCVTRTSHFCQSFTDTVCRIPCESGMFNAEYTVCCSSRCEYCLDQEPPDGIGDVCMIGAAVPQCEDSTETYCRLS